ncbi:unnamed protein product [Plutella xylostella]|uniref:(diamondback moth) hypothetical protein n=1 Tax=Plutella xylostella TaxID=51655 RepID=A0A8S4FSH4_PLUXY|nr:unnamed protein product [Plutella xylostella]
MQLSVVVLMASAVAGAEWGRPGRRSVLIPALQHFVATGDQLVEIQRSVEVAQTHYQQFSEPNQAQVNAKLQDSTGNGESSYQANVDSGQRLRTNPSSDHGTQIQIGERQSDQAVVKPQTIPQYIEIAQKYGGGVDSSQNRRKPDDTEAFGSTLNKNTENYRPVERNATGRPHTNVNNSAQQHSNENNRKTMNPVKPTSTYVRIAQSVEKILPTYQAEYNNNERTDVNHGHKKEPEYLNGNQRPQNVPAPVPSSDTTRHVSHNAPDHHHASNDQIFESSPLPTSTKTGQPPVRPDNVPPSNSQSGDSHQSREPIDNRDKYYHKTSPERVDQDTKVQERNGTKVEDRWVWGMEEQPTTEVLTVTLDDRGNFVGDKCPSNKVKVMSKCVMPD